MVEGTLDRVCWTDSWVRTAVAADKPRQGAVSKTWLTISVGTRSCTEHMLFTISMYIFNGAL